MMVLGEESHQNFLVLMFVKQNHGRIRKYFFFRFVLFKLLHLAQKLTKDCVSLRTLFRLLADLACGAANLPHASLGPKKTHVLLYEKLAH